MPEKILIIDDDVDTLKLVGLMLERQGYRIAVASNGLLGISKAGNERPDLILLDVMMPDLDGYEVTKRLRADPNLAHIPVIMFTAKSMVDDKVAGFEAGVDDYLTKPTHPAELTAHVKAVLTRSVQAKAVPVERARVVGFLGVRGGVGTTTLALNVSVLLQQADHEIILAEINPGRGTLALELNLSKPVGLGNLLSRSLKDIHLRSVETELISHRSGLRLLLASPHPHDSEMEQAVPQVEAVVSNLASMCTTLVLDLGAGLRPYVKPVLKSCDRVIVVFEPIHPTNIICRHLMDDLEASGFSRHRVSVALVTRERTSLTVPWQQIEADLGTDVAGIVSPAPEQAHQASQSGNPVVLMHRDSLISDQIRKLADNVASQLQLVPS